MGGRLFPGLLVLMYSGGIMRFGLGLDCEGWASTVLSGDGGESAKESAVKFTAGLIGGTGTRRLGDRGVRGTGGIGWDSSTGKLGTSGVGGALSLPNILIKPLFLCFKDLTPGPTALSGVSTESFRCLAGRLKSVTTLWRTAFAFPPFPSERV